MQTTSPATRVETWADRPINIENQLVIDGRSNTEDAVSQPVATLIDAQ